MRLFITITMTLLGIGFTFLLCRYYGKKGQLKMTDEEITEVDFSCSNFLFSDDNCM